ncbi:MAG: hypothetical protein WAL84_12120 [Candidatus Dormiibacterota bacterium]
MTLPSPCKHALAAGACVATLLVTACGATTAIVTPSTSPAASASPAAASQPFVASGFRTGIPAGWQDQTTNPNAVAALTGGGAVLMLLASPDRGVIVARTTPQPVADDQLGQHLTSIVPPGAVDVSPAEPVDVDGVSGVVITFVVIATGTAAQEDEEMVVNQAGNTYEIALHTAQASFARDAALLQQVLNTWRWA